MIFSKDADDDTTTPINISSTEEIDLHAYANEGVPQVDQSLVEIIPLEQSFASQASIVNLYKDLSLDFHPEK